SQQKRHTAGESVTWAKHRRSAPETCAQDGGAWPAGGAGEGGTMELDTGATAWMLTSASLVLLMTPGLALFYGGMTRSKSVLNMMMMSFGAMAVIAVVYVLWGWSVSYGTSVGGIFGNPIEQFGLAGTIYGAD